MTSSNLTSLAMFSLQNSAVKIENSSTDNAATTVIVAHPVLFQAETSGTAATLVPSRSPGVVTTRLLSCFFLVI